MNLDTLFDKWVEAKENQKKYDELSRKYRKSVENYMNKKNTGTLHGKYYTATRRNNVKQTLSRKNVPKSIWDQYSTRSAYKSYYLKKK